MIYFHLIDKCDAINAIVNLTNCATPTELIDYCDKHDLKDRWTGGLVDAISAVVKVPKVMIADDRLVPKKPHVHRIHFSYKPDELIVQCPNCKRRLKSQLNATNPYAYCPKCGQAIDWEGVC